MPKPAPATESSRAVARLRRRHWRWLRRVGWFAATVVLVAAAGLFLLTRSFILTPLLSWQLSAALGSQVHIEQATWHWPGGVSLQGVEVDLAVDPATLDHPDNHEHRDGYARLLEVGRIDVTLDGAALRNGKLQLSTLAIDAPILSIIEDADRGTVNLTQWLFPVGPDTGEAAAPIVLPKQITLDNAGIRFERIENGNRHEVATIRITGSLTPEPDGVSQRFVIEQTDAGPRKPLRVTGLIDPATPRITVQVDEFDFSHPVGILIPPALRDVWAELDPRGAFPTLNAAFTDNGEGGLTLGQAELVLRDLAVTVPVDALGIAERVAPDATTDINADHAVATATATANTNTETDTTPHASKPAPAPQTTAPGDPYAIRMTDVNGRVTLRDNVLRVQTLRGLIEGVRYTIDGEQSLDTGALRLSASTDPFDLQADPPFILRLPGVVKNLYGKYQPRGRFRAEAIIQRDGHEAPVQFEGEVELIDAHAAFYKFPFPLNNIHGVIRFNDDGLTLNDLHAVGPNGGTLVLNGWVTDPGSKATAKVDVTIDATDIPLDDALIAALKPEAQTTVRAFFHEPSYTRLREAGLFDTPAQQLRQPTQPGSPAANAPPDAADAPDARDAGDTRHAADARTAPAVDHETEQPPPPFALGGRASAKIHIVRDLDVAPKTQVTTRVRVAGLGMVFKHWPYPLVGESGAIEITSHRVTLDRVSLRGPTGATALITGTLDLPGGGKPVVPDITLERIAIPTDAFLAASLPEDSALWLRRCGVTGILHGTGKVMPGKTRPVSYRIDGHFQDATVRPYHGSFVIEDTSGTLHVEPNLLILDDIHGRRGDAVLTFAGRIDADASPNRFELTGRATNLAIEPALADLLDPDTDAHIQLQELFDRYRPAGTTAAQLRIARAASDDPTLKIDLSLQPAELSADYAGKRVDAHDMTGQVLIRPGFATLQKLRGLLKDDDSQTPHGWAQADGTISLDAKTDSALSVTAQSTTDCPVTRALLPDAAVQAIDALELRGTYTLDAGRALWRANPDHDEPATEFEADVHLTDATATLGVAITDLDTTLNATIHSFAGKPFPQIQLAFDAQQLRAAGRRIAPLHATLSNHRKPAWLAFQDVAGNVYGGTLTARGGIPLAGKGRYQIDLTLHEAAVGPFLDPASEPAPPEPTEPPTQPTQPADATPNAPQAPTAPEANANANGDPAPRILQRSRNTGLLSASLTLEADLEDPDSRTGRGNLIIRDAKLLSQSFGIALLRTLNFGLPSDAPLDHATARFLIHGPVVRFDELTLTGPGLEIRGKGTMTYPDSTLDLALFTRNKAAPQLGPISDLINAIKDEFIGIHVTGTLGQPVSRVVSLSGLKSSWEQVFGQTQPPLNKDTRNANADE